MFKENENNLDSILFEVYYSPNSPGAYSTGERLYKFIKQNYAIHVTRKKVNEWLQSQHTHTIHRNRRIRFKRNHYNITNIDDLWEMDLIDIQNFSRQNKGNKYILAVIDCFSRFAWCIPIKKKTPSEIIRAFDILFSGTSRRPIKLQSDKGKEFDNRSVKKYLLEKDITFQTTRDPTTKAAICERFIRTIKGIIFKYFTHIKSKKYVDVIDGLTFIYNNRIHSSIGMQPAEVNESNVLKVWSHMQKKREKSAKKKKAKLAVGDYVRIANPKVTFEKGYTPKWSEEVFSIDRVLRRIPVVYNIKDSDGNTINANFYENELQKICKQ
jgi:Integrase core domain